MINDHSASTHSAHAFGIRRIARNHLDALRDVGLAAPVDGAHPFALRGQFAHDGPAQRPRGSDDDV